MNNEVNIVYPELHAMPFINLFFLACRLLLTDAECRQGMIVEITSIM